MSSREYDHPRRDQLNTISAHIKFIKRNYILRKIVADVIIRTKLSSNGFLRCQQISDLHIQLLTTLVAYKINFLITRSTNSPFNTVANI